MHRTKKLTVTALAAAMLMAGGVSSAMADHRPGHAGKITICHRTASDSNPYVKITISENARHAHIGSEAHPPKGDPLRYDFEIAPNQNCSNPQPPPPPPPPPPANESDDCDASSGSGNSTQSQNGLVNVGNVNLGLNNVLANGFCHSNVGNGLAIAGIGDALAGYTGSGSGDGDCSAEDISGDSSQSQNGLVNVGNINVGGNNLLANAFCQSDVLNGLAIAGIGDAFAGSVGSGLGDGDCSAESISGDSDQDQDGAVNVGNINLGGDNLLANAFCQSDVLNGLAVSLIGPAIGGSSLGSDLLSGGPLGLLSGAPDFLLSGLTADVRVLANVLVLL